MSLQAVPHLNYLNFQLFEPTPVLQPFIQQYWLIQHPFLAEVSRPEFIHPNGGFGLVFNFGDAFWVDEQKVAGTVFLDGSNTVSRRLRFAGKVLALGIRFRPGKAHPFLKIPLHHLHNEILLLADLDQRGLEDLADQLDSTPLLLAKIQRLENWLIKQLAQGSKTSAIVPTSLRTLRAQRILTIKELADQLYLSQRQLERLYRREVGFTPKQYARLLRVENARHLLKTQLDQSTAQIGAALDFYDQAHFIREFRALVGLTPGQYQQRQRERLEKT